MTSAALALSDDPAREDRFLSHCRLCPIPGYQRQNNAFISYTVSSTDMSELWQRVSRLWRILARSVGSTESSMYNFSGTENETVDECCSTTNRRHTQVPMFSRRQPTYTHVITHNTTLQFRQSSNLVLIKEGDASLSSYFICQKRRRATRKAKAHHTLVAHYITIVNVRIKHTTHISTYKHSKQVYHSTHYTLTHTQT